MTNRFLSCIIEKPLREWRNWQTRTFEGRVVLPYGFDPRFPHQQKAPSNRCFLFFLCAGNGIGRTRPLGKCVSIIPLEITGTVISATPVSSVHLVIGAFCFSLCGKWAWANPSLGKMRQHYSFGDNSLCYLCDPRFLGAPSNSVILLTEYHAK